MKHKTLMLITDISGYTRFITQAGHTSGLHHAQELLQIIINSNTLGLKLCEVEGDAVFFYTMKKLPTAKALFKQIGRTYKAFHHYLAKHHLEEFLGLKFFVHTGECEEMRIGGRVKLFGTEVIKIHRLLKCIPDKSDYLLVTKSAESLLADRHDDMSSGEVSFAHLGNIEYSLLDQQSLDAFTEEEGFYFHLRRLLSDSANALAVEFGRYFNWSFPLVTS